MSTPRQRTAPSRLKRRKKKVVGKTTPVEVLEPRCVLAVPDFVGLDSVFQIQAGTALNLPLNSIDADGDGVAFSVSIDNPLIEASVPAGNRSVRLSVVHQASGPGDVAFTDDITIELLEGIAPKTTEKFIDLVESGAYDGLIFHRIISGFVAQFGDPTGTGTGGSGVSIDDEFSKLGRHSSLGLLSTAKSLDDTFDMQAFLTLGITRFLDFNHVVFGVTTTIGAGIDFDGVLTGAGDRPLSPVTIQDASIFSDNENGVLRLFVPDNVAPGTTANLTLTVTDDNGDFTTQVVQVQVLADNFDDQPFFDPDPTPMVADFGETVSFTLQATDIESDPMEFLEGTPQDYAARGLFKDPNLQVIVDSNTGEVTVTPTGFVVGTKAVLVKVRQIGNLTGAQDFQIVPISFRPDAPLGIALLSDSGVLGDGTTAVNNTGGIPLEFRVDGVFPGAPVELLVDGVPFQNVIAPAAGSLVVTLDGESIVADGDYSITARFAFVETLPFGNFDPFVVNGDETVPLAVTIDTRPINFVSSPSTTATPTVLYTYDANSDRDPEAGLVYELDVAPVGMTIDPVTGVVQWTPSFAQAGDNPVTLRVVDIAGNAAQQSFTIVANTTPMLLEVGDQTIDEGMLLDVQLSVDDQDVGETLTFEFVGAVPDGAAIDNTGRFTFTPTEAQGPGSFDISVRVTDSRGATDETTFAVQVDEVQQAPLVGSVDDQFVLTGTTLSISIVASDPDIPQRPLTFSLEAGAPAEASIDPTSGLFTFDAPAGSSLGMLSITVRVTEGAGADERSTTTTFNVNVVDNLPPFFPTQTTSFSGKASDPLSFDVVAMDPDPVPVDLTFSLDPGAPAFVSIDPTTGRVTVTTARETPPQTFNIVVRVTEISPDALTATETFSVEITPPPNVPPVFPAQPMSFTTEASVLLSFGVTAIDPAPGASPLTFSLEPGVPGFVTIDAASGVVTVATTRETPVQTFNVVVRATEIGPDALTTTETFTVEITAPPNLPPVFPPQPMSFTTAASVPLSFNATATDPTPGASLLTYSLEPGVPDFVAIDAATGLVTVTTTRETPLQTFDIVVRVTEIGSDALTTTETFSVEITTPPNLPPVFPAQPMAFTTEAGSPLSFGVTATDPDETPVPLTFSLEPGTPGFVAIDPATGLVTVTSSRLTPLQTIDVVVRVTEVRPDALTATETFTVELTAPPNLPPVFPTQPTEFTTEVGDRLLFDVTAIDPAPGQVPLVFSLEPNAPEIVSIDGATGRVTVVSTTETLPQTIRFVVRATEVQIGGLSATQAFTIQLVPVSNKIPVISPVAKQTVTRGRDVKFTIQAIDPDTPPVALVFRLSAGAPSEATIDPATGEVTFLSTAATAVGVHRFGVEVVEAVADGLRATVDVEVDVLQTDYRDFISIGNPLFGSGPAEVLPTPVQGPSLAAIIGQFSNSASQASSTTTNPPAPRDTFDSFSNGPFNNIIYGVETGVGRSFSQESDPVDENPNNKPLDEESTEENIDGVVPTQATEPVDETQENENPQGDASTEQEDKETPSAAVWDDRLIDWASTEHWAPGHETFARSMNASVNRSRAAEDNADPYDIDLEPLVVHSATTVKFEGAANDQTKANASRGSGFTVILPAPASEEASESPVVEELPFSEEIAAVAASAAVAFYVPLLVTDLPETKQPKGRWRPWLRED